MRVDRRRGGGGRRGDDEWQHHREDGTCRVVFGELGAATHSNGELIEVEEAQTGRGAGLG